MVTRKTETMDLKGKEYAKVPARIKEFRQDCPNGLIETTPTFLDNGQILFKARILKDKSDINSAEGTGHALGVTKGEKDFEKLETISVGRALAMLGYMASGEIASSEEMEEFQEFQKTKKEQMIEDLKEKIDSIENLEDLKKCWEENKGLGAEIAKYITNKKRQLEGKSTNQ